MKSLFCAVVLFALFSIITSIPSPRISFGTRAKNGAWPSQVLMLTGEDPGRVCGGAIISSEWVLTVAHCVRENEDGEPHNPMSYKLLFGVYDRYKPGPETVERGIAQIVRHPQYETQNHSHDMALIKMDKPLDFNGKEKHLKPICLDLKGVNINNADCFVTGFGRTSDEYEDNNNVPSYLQQLQVKPFDHEKCHKIHEDFFKDYDSKESVTDLQICMVSKAPGGNNPSKGGVCSGDSGGPLQCKVKNNWYQIGVTWSTTKCETAPGVYQAVYKYSKFITDHTGYRLPDYCSK